jgi:hypothetical protein
VTDETVKNKLTIAGKTYEVSPRYAEGHVLTANEASTLNQTLYENLRNNFAGKVKDDGEAATQEAFDKYVESYKFGERSGGGGGSRDPIEVEAMNLAREAVRKAITAKGGKVGDYSAAAISAAAKQLVDTKPVFREKAAERVAQMQAVATDTIGDDIMSTLTATPAEPTSEEPTIEEGAPSEEAATPAEEGASTSGSRRRRG